MSFEFRVVRWARPRADCEAADVESRFDSLAANSTEEVKDVSIAQRLQRLEQENARLRTSHGRLRRAVVALSVVVAAAFSLGAGESLPDVVRAKRFVVMSEDGQRQAVDLRTTPHGNGLISVYQSNGYPSVQLDTTPGIGGMMTVFDDRGYSMVRAEVTAPHDGLLTGFNAGGHRLFRLGADPAAAGGGGAVLLEDGQGRVTDRLPAADEAAAVAPSAK